MQRSDFYEMTRDKNKIIFYSINSINNEYQIMRCVARDFAHLVLPVRAVQAITTSGKAWRAPRQRLYPPSAFH